MRVKDLMSRQGLTIGTSGSCLEAVGRMHQALTRVGGVAAQLRYPL
jgi:hypothetical protein